MIDFSKPKISKFNERCDMVVEFLKKREYVTKAEIAEHLGLVWPKQDRQIRDMIAHISWIYPIVSTSDTNKGYKLAKEVSDVEAAKHSLLELYSRIDEIRKRSVPIVNFLKNNNSTLTLF